MRSKPTVTVTMDADLLVWIKDHTKDSRRGTSGFVTDACKEAKRKVTKSK